MAETSTSPSLHAMASPGPSTCRRALACPGSSFGAGGPAWAGRPLWSDDIPGDQALRAPAGRTLSDDPDRTAVGVDARENLLSVSAYGRQRQSHDKCSSNSRYSRHDVSIVGDEGAR